MPEVSESIEIKASPKRCFAVITDYASYPEFNSTLKSVEIKGKSGTSAEVTYEIDLIKKIRYTLKMKGTPYSKVEWSFVKGDVMKDNHGFWKLEEVKKGLTRATYNIQIEFGLLVPGAITKMLVGKNLPSMLKGFKDRIESL